MPSNFPSNAFYPQSKFVSTTRRVTSTVCQWVSVATLIMALVTFAIVGLRYGIGVGWIAMQESVMYLHALVFMLGLAHTLDADGHVRVDVFYRNFSVRGKAWTNLMGSIFLLIPVCVFILIYSVPYVKESWLLLESSQEAGGLPLVFLLKSLIPLGTLLLLVQGVSDIVCNIALLARRTKE